MNYIGLLIECPKKDEETNCPFKTFRKMPLSDAFRFWEIMNHAKKKELIKQHFNCSFKPTRP